MKIFKLIMCIGCVLWSASSIANSNWPAIIKIGYLENLNYVNDQGRTTPTYQEASDHGYNVVNIAFGKVQGTSVSFFDNGYNSSGYAPYADQSAFIQAVDNFHQLNDNNKILISLGSDQGTKLWNPDENNTDELAQNIVSFLADNHLDGIDLDLEGGQNAKTQFLADLITKIRIDADNDKDHFPQGFFVTAAPQFFPGNTIGWAGNDGDDSKITELMSMPTSTDRPMFDALLVQNYNNGLGISADQAFSYIKELGVPNDTKIVIGMPAAAGAGSGYVDPVELSNQLIKIQQGGDQQYGGLMVWTSAFDKGAEWSFSNGLGDIT